MSILYDGITLIRLQTNTTVNAIEKAAGLSTGSLKNWATSMPSGDKILRVANYFDVSVDYLLGNTDNPVSHKNVSIFDDSSITAINIAAEKLAKSLSEGAEAERQMTKFIRENHLYREKDPNEKMSKLKSNH